MIPLGMHLRNDGPPSWRQLSELQQWQPRLVVVTEPYRGFIPQIRELVPGVFIVLRLYGAGGVYDAWSLPWQDDPARFRLFGADSGRWLASQELRYMPDTVQWANEPSIEWAGWVPSTEAYGQLNLVSAAFLDGWLSTAEHIRLSPVPASPGQHEDDDPGDRIVPGAAVDVIGADLLRETYLRHWGPFISHSYGPNDEYHAYRFTRQLRAFQWLERANNPRWLVGEYNTMTSEPEQCDLLREWYRSEVPAGCIGGAWYIQDSGDHSFDFCNLEKRGSVRAAIAGIAAEQIGARV